MGHLSAVILSAVTAEEEGVRSPARLVVEPRAHFAVARLQRDFRTGRSGVGLMVTRVDRGDGDSATAAMIPTSAQAAALTTQHQTGDGNFRLSGWLGGSEVRGSPAAIAALQRSNVHGFHQPDDDERYDSTRTELRGAASQLFMGKVAGGITRYDVSYRWISPGFDVNEMRFLTASGLQSLNTNAGLRATRAGRIAGVPYRTASVTLGFAGDWSSAGLPFARGLSLTGTMQLENQMQLQGSASQQLPGAYCTVSCTRGGRALVDEPRSRLVVDVRGDPRRALVPHVSGEWYRDDDGRSNGGGGQVDVVWRARSNLDLFVALTASDATHDAFFYHRLGDALSDTARVVVARLDQPVRSITSRLDYTVTTALTIQWYAQTYVSRGTYTNAREIVSPRAERYDDRFRPVIDTTVPSGPGGADFRQFRSNAVLRWEYRPGSTVFVVWTQGRDLGSSDGGELRFGPDVRDLFRQRPANQIAIKLSYWWSR